MDLLRAPPPLILPLVMEYETAPLSKYLKLGRKKSLVGKKGYSTKNENRTGEGQVKDPEDEDDGRTLLNFLGRKGSNRLIWGVKDQLRIFDQDILTKVFKFPQC